MIRLLFVWLTHLMRAGHHDPRRNAGAGEPPALRCAEGERADEIGRVCVPITGTRTCRLERALTPSTPGQRGEAVLYAAPQAAGDGSGSDAAAPAVSG